ncbi:ParA family protein [Candidatus Protofrankia datiscae]|nr:ParA family protein [Candidatus Protofrankia datiscae]
MFTTQGVARAMRILIFASQKGGVGKTTSALNITHLLAETLAARVLLLDTDPNGDSARWADRARAAGVQLRFDYTAETDPRLLGHVREVAEYDVIVVDTPGARESAALLAVVRHADAVILPSPPAALDLAGLARTVRDVVRPSGVPFRVLLTRVDPRSIPRAEQARTDLVEQGYGVFSTIIRSYAAHEDAALAGVPIGAYRGRYASEADLDYRRVTAEVIRDYVTGDIR